MVSWVLSSQTVVLNRSSFFPFTTSDTFRLESNILTVKHQCLFLCWSFSTFPSLLNPLSRACSMLIPQFCTQTRQKKSAQNLILQMCAKNLQVMSACVGWWWRHKRFYWTFIFRYPTHWVSSAVSSANIQPTAMFIGREMSKERSQRNK